MARRFLFVCGGMFLLALTYHLGAENATSQVTSTIGGVRFGATISLVAASNGDFYRDDHAADGSNPRWALVGHIPATSPIVAVGNESDLTVLAYASNGDFFSSPDFGATWEPRGNLFSGVPATPESWGRLKHRYRN